MKSTLELQQNKNKTSEEILKANKQGLSLWIMKETVSENNLHKSAKENIEISKVF